MKRFLDIVFAITHPRFWISNYKTDAKHDALINRILDINSPVRFDGKFVADVGNTRLWVSNYPYAFGHAYPVKDDDCVLPYRRTRQRLKRYIDSKRV